MGSRRYRYSHYLDSSSESPKTLKRMELKVISKEVVLLGGRGTMALLTGLLVSGFNNAARSRSRPKCIEISSMVMDMWLSLSVKVKWSTMALEAASFCPNFARARLMPMNTSLAVL